MFFPPSVERAHLPKSSDNPFIFWGGDTSSSMNYGSVFVCKLQEFQIIPLTLFHLSIEEIFAEDIGKYTDE